MTYVQFAGFDRQSVSPFGNVFIVTSFHLGWCWIIAPEPNRSAASTVASAHLAVISAHPSHFGTRWTQKRQCHRPRRSLARAFTMAFFYLSVFGLAWLARFGAFLGALPRLRKAQFALIWIQHFRRLPRISDLYCFRSRVGLHFLPGSLNTICPGCHGSAHPPIPICDSDPLGR